MLQGSAPLIHRADYRPPAFWIRTVHLTFDLDPTRTVVTSRMTVERNPAVPLEPLHLHGEALELLHVLVDGTGAAFRLQDDGLRVDGVPDGDFTLEIRNLCAPECNTRLSGLYASGGGLFSQCEAEGFRRITYFLDRPDVMAVYTVVLRADKARFPVLLANGNLVDSGELTDGRHMAVWHDPFPKPSYLFAVVAADLVKSDRHIRSRAGKEHLLQIYVRQGDLHKTAHAMDSLVAAIDWDEARFGLPLDLERFMVVGVSDFNMGAMENKGLNLFNTAALLASPATATDEDYSRIQMIVAHEYFHNWTGNRVTCRDWFQLSLKEGLTVFRHQQFAMDRAGSPSARAVCRIQDVQTMRNQQFAEDRGAMAHPVRPDSYSEISNFYTATVYMKGAEVVSMMQALVGREGFVAGIELYFERHDGQAATCDDLVQAIADANPGSALGVRLDAFKRWYSQAGTPRVTARGVYDPAARTYTLHLAQRNALAPLPAVIPVALGLLDRSGQALPLRLQGEPQDCGVERVLVLDQAAQAFVFEGIDGDPVPSLLRGFSAPVIVDDGHSDADLMLLLRHDGDPVNRWEAGQRLTLDRLLAALRSGQPLVFDAAFIDAMRAVLDHDALDPAFKALVLTLPGEGYIADQLGVVDPQAIHAVVVAARAQLASQLRDGWARAFEQNQTVQAYSPDPASAGRRALSNLALAMLVLDAQATRDTAWPARAYQRFKDADNMTERQGSLAALVNAHAELAELALARFHAAYKDEALVVDKWFALQAGAPESDGRVFARARRLMQHPDFSLGNPNRARSVLASLCLSNPGAFHRADGAGYELWADQVLAIDAGNPMLAGRLARGMDGVAQLAPPYRVAARAAVARVAAHAGLSSEVREIVDRALASCDAGHIGS